MTNKYNHRSFENGETDMKTIARCAYVILSLSDFQRNINEIRCQMLSNIILTNQILNNNCSNVILKKIVIEERGNFNFNFNFIFIAQWKFVLLTFYIYRRLRIYKK